MEGSGTAVETMTNTTGGRRHRSLKKVSAKTIRRTLRKAGIKPKGRMVLTGGVALSPSPLSGGAMPYGGRRRRGTRRGKKSRRSLFGMIKY
jgi:hypothetical protein